MRSDFCATRGPCSGLPGAAGSCDSEFRSVLRAAWWLVPVSLLCAACGRHEDGPPRAEVAGIVSVDGRPLATGSIVFTPAAGNVGPEVRVPIADGRFRIDPAHGPGAGTCRVAIYGRPDPGYPLDDADADAARGRKPLPPDPIPDRYNRRTELEAHLESAQPNTLEFALRTK